MSNVLNIYFSLTKLQKWCIVMMLTEENFYRYSMLKMAKILHNTGTAKRVKCVLYDSQNPRVKLK